MSELDKHFYEFGLFRLDERERRLLRNGVEVTLPDNGKDERLPPKAFDLLLVLVKQSGEMVKREELLEQLWPGTFVEDNRLSDNISTLRRFLGDRTRNPQFIETIPKYGYRFVADVREVRDGDALLIAEQTRTRIVVEEDDQLEVSAGSPARIGDSDRTLALPPARVKRLLWVKTLTVAAAAVLMVAVVAYYFIRTAGHGAQPQQFNSLAVLPLNQLGAISDEDEYLGQGLADALITKLSNVRQIAVRPTSAVMKYGGAPRDLQAIAREQQVDAVLDGSFQRAGERLRVTLQLVRASDGAPLWAGTFDERLTDIFTVQDAISVRVADALKLQLSSEEQGRFARRPTESSEAYQLYLRGRYHWNRRTADGINKAVEYFNQAIGSDPSYALAHAGLADSYSLLPEYTNAPFHESMAKAKAASLQALEIDNTLAEAHVSLAYVKYSEWDWDGIEDEYRRGLALNPNYSTGHQWYSEYLVFRGRTDEALKEIKLAQQLDPLSLIINTRVGMTFYYSRRYEEAIEQLRKTLEFDPDFILVHIFLYSAFSEKGMHREAIPHLVKGFFHIYSSEERARIETTLTAAYDGSGEKGLLEKLRDILKGAEKRDYNYPYSMADTYMRLGEKDQAFLWLQKAMDVRHPGVGALKVAPVMDGLRTDERYSELLRRMNL